VASTGTGTPVGRVPVVDERRSVELREEAAASHNREAPQIKDDPRQGGRRRGSSCISPGGSG
jgi:hypothetical protein